MHETANVYQIGGTHYQGTEYQCWDFLADVYGQSYFKSQIVRYVVRWRKKNGKEDLEKALHYANKLHEMTYKGLKLSSEANLGLVSKFYEAGGVEVADASIIADVLGSSCLQDLDVLMLKLNNLINQCTLDEEPPF